MIKDTDKIPGQRTTRLRPNSRRLTVGLLALASAAIAFLVATISMNSTEPVPKYTNQIDDNRTLIVLAAPSIHEPYYKKHFRKLIEFDIRFAQAANGNDNLIVLADTDTLPHLRDHLPADQLLEAEVDDIWLRDFGTIHPHRMVHFRYDRPGEALIQNSLRKFIQKYDLKFMQNPLKIDGGNFVDNGADLAVMTEKVYDRNRRLSKIEIRKRIKTALGLKHLAIIPMDDEHLGHADGMLMFVSKNTILMNRYPDDAKFTATVEAALRKSLPGVTVQKITGDGYGEKYGPYASACGIYVNATVTERNIYMPVFGADPADQAALKTVRAFSDKRVIPVPAGAVCELGGSVRCLSWQLTGTNAKKLILAARRN